MVTAPMATVSYGEQVDRRRGRWHCAGDRREGISSADDEVYVLRHGRQTRVRIQDFAAATATAGAGDGVIKAPMHGKVLDIVRQRRRRRSPPVSVSP